MRDVRVIVHQSLWNALDVFLVTDRPDGSIALGQIVDGRIVMNPRDPGDYMDPPTLRLPMSLIEPLIDGLSAAGYRPTRDAKLEGTLEATRAHLEDLRKLVGTLTDTELG